MESTNKKIIALLPEKNESWILPEYLKSMSLIADEILALDDGSTDNSVEILKKQGVKIIQKIQTGETNMSLNRQILLDEGRRQGGTHFIWLDADETFSNDFLKNGRGTILQLKAGEKISMRWIHLWKDCNHYLDDPLSPFGYIWKDFIYCDDGASSFQTKRLSESRTPGNNHHTTKLPEETGVVLHFQFVDWSRVQYKQVWYRCVEFLEEKKSPRKINNMYSITKDCGNYTVREAPVHWIDQNLKIINDNPSWHKDEILKLFKETGIQVFESLDIWHIKELEELFINSTGRKPRPVFYPAWLIKLNNIKNKLKNLI